MASGQHWQFTQIAASDQGGYFPRISDGRAVWQRYDGNDSEIYLFDGSAITQLTDNTTEETQPNISGDHIVWYSGEYDDTDIVYDGRIVMEGVKNHTDMRFEDGGLSWSAVTAPYDVSHVFFFDGITTKRLSLDGTRHNHNPDVSGTNVVWSGFNNNGATAYFFDGTSTVELPDNVGRGQTPQISGNSVVGVEAASDGINHMVFLHEDGVNTQLGSAEGWVAFPRIAGGNIAWLSYVAGEFEIFAFENGVAKQLSFDSVHVYPPVVSESLIVWSADDGDGFDLFAYDGVSTTQLTDDTFEDHAPDISGNTIVWTRTGENVGPEVFMASYVVPEPATASIFALSMTLFSACRLRYSARQ